MRSCDVPQKQKGDDIFTSVPNSGSCLSFTKDISSKDNKNRVSSCNSMIFFFFKIKGRVLL